MGGSRKRVLTPADERAAAKVRTLWAEYQKKHPGVSQERAAQDAGMGQSAFSQFLIGRVPMRVAPVLKFASLFGVDPNEIRDDLPALAYSSARLPRGGGRAPNTPRYRTTGQKRARSDAEKLLALVQTFLKTDSRGREALYAQALAVTAADEESRPATRADSRARAKGR